MEPRPGWGTQQCVHLIRLITTSESDNYSDCGATWEKEVTNTDVR